MEIHVVERAFEAWRETPPRAGVEAKSADAFDAADDADAREPVAAVATPAAPPDPDDARSKRLGAKLLARAVEDRVAAAALGRWRAARATLSYHTA